MSPYDPKQKRAHSPTIDEGPAPVDDLLAPAAAPRAVPAVVEPWRAPTPVSAGPDPKVIALAAGAAVAVLLAWRWRRR